MSVPETGSGHRLTEIPRRGPRSDESTALEIPVLAKAGLWGMVASRSFMSKLIAVLRRSTDQDRNLFLDSCRDAHRSLHRVALHTIAPTDDATSRGRGMEPHSAPCDAVSLSWPQSRCEAEDRVAALEKCGRVDAWLADEVVHWDQLKANDDGSVPGLKMLSFVGRPKDMTESAFRTRYLEHVEIARIHHPGVARYVQNFVAEPLTTDAPELDALAELSFATEDDACTRFYRDGTSPDVVARDVRRFLDLRHAWSVEGTETRL